MFFIFQKIKLFNPKLKKLLLFRRTTWFSLLFSGLFIADCICLIQVFLFHHWFCYCFSSVFISPTFFTVPVFYQVLRFCVVVPRVLRIWESFVYSQTFFTLNSFPTFDTTCFYQGFPGASSSALKLTGSPTEVQNIDSDICLFESHSFQQKVLVDRFYLSIKALRNIVTTSSRFWTQYLIAIYYVKPIPYPLGHRSS